MAEHAVNSVTSAVTNEITSRVFSGLVQRYGKDAATSKKLQRLEMLLIKINSAIEASEKITIENSWLLLWRDKLKEAAEQGDQVLARFLQQVKDTQAIVDAEANQQQGEAASSSAAAPARAVSALSFTMSSLSGLVQGICGATKMLFWRVDDDMERLSRTLGRLEKLSSNMAEFIRLIHLEALPTDESTSSSTRVHGPTKTRKRRKTSITHGGVSRCAGPRLESKLEKADEMMFYCPKRDNIELSPCDLALSLALRPAGQQIMLPRNRLRAAFSEISKAMELSDRHDFEDLECLSYWADMLSEVRGQVWYVLCTVNDAAEDNQEQADELNSFMHRLEGLVRYVGHFRKLVHLCPAFYSLRSELLVSEMDVFRTKLHLDTSISATSNSERRE